ncbi:MAG: 1,4-dihydroxy-2-naphthoate polyprenyltransferase [Acidimicrobiia bacterium]
MKFARQNGAGAWLVAARPHTLWAAVGPVVVGAGLAVGDRALRWDAFGAALLGAVAIQVGANFANDASDARRGADAPGRLGPPRAVAAGLLSERAVWVGTWMVFGLAALAGLYLTALAGPVVLVIGLASIAAALGYTGGRRPYGYRGLGEAAVFVFFGPVATVMSRYVHDRTAPLDAWLLAVPVGLLVTAILVANNIRDIETDAAVGKRTLAVRLGRPRTAALYRVLVWGAWAAIGLFSVIGWTPPWTALALLAAPLAVPLVRAIGREVSGPEMIRVLQRTARLHALVSALLGVGAALGR